MRRLNASSSVTSSPTKTAAVAPTWWRMRVEREALVGLDHGELDHLLALARMHAGQLRRALAHGRASAAAVLLEACR